MIRVDFVGWYWIEIVDVAHTSTCVNSTLPIPEIVTRSEIAETNQVGTTTAFEVELTAPLVHQSNGFAQQS